MKVEVYIDNGLVFSYSVANAEKAREHSHAIVMTGYRHATEDCFEHFGPHRILKVKVTGGKVDTKYPDEVRGT
jgi:hypothetical protein